MSQLPNKKYLPLCLLRIWCRKTDSWLSFTTIAGDRYLVGAGGYFIELPNGVLAPIGARSAFPTIDLFPSIVLDELAVKREFGPETRLISVPASGPRSGKPQAISLDALNSQLNYASEHDSVLTPVERYLALRLLESAIVNDFGLKQAIRQRRSNETLGQTLITRDICDWETLLSACLDIRPPSRLDPPSMRTLAQRREWELTGEILIAAGKLSRTRLEEALLVKREGSRALGEILTSMGACSQQDIERCLEIQKESRQSVGAGVALIGQLLITRGVLSWEALESAIRNQKVGRQSLEKILKSMGVCTDQDIAAFVRANNWHSFQDEIDDIRLGHWLEKVGVISRQQLDEALRIQERGRQVLGEMLVALRLCTTSDIDNVLRIQKDIRAGYLSGVEKIGAILVRNHKVEPERLKEALEIQSVGRQKIGCILVALKACKEQDISMALDVQRTWRERSSFIKDRLGDVLRADGVVTVEELNCALARHVNEKLPLGRLLVEERICTPEQIITALIARDCQRQSAFRAFLKVELARLEEESSPASVAVAAGGPVTPFPVAPLSTQEESFLGKISSWMKKRQ